MSDQESSFSLLQAHLPAYLLAHMRVQANGGAWPFILIPAVIEASRIAGLINLGGDLQATGPSGLWESPNIGVWVFKEELSGSETHADQAASVAMTKFIALGGETVLLEEAAIGWSEANQSSGDLRSQLYFSWTVARS